MRDVTIDPMTIEDLGSNVGTLEFHREDNLFDKLCTSTCRIRRKKKKERYNDAILIEDASRRASRINCKDFRNPH